jgi:hypothetical protein
MNGFKKIIEYFDSFVMPLLRSKYIDIIPIEYNWSLS